MARPIHYHGHGARGLSFTCYAVEYGRHRDSGDPNAPEDRRWQTRTVPEPLVRTDLRKVTCPACWAEIAKLAQARLR